MGLVIVTVVKNDPEGLDYTLSSIGRQDATARLLIMDGASTDTTLEVIERWRSSLPMEVESQPDSGPYDAMNRAIAKLEDDDLVWFINAGDGLVGDSAISTALELTLHTDFTWGFGPHQIIEATGEPRRVIRGQSFTVRTFAYGRTPICHQAVIARAFCLRAVGGFDLRYPIAADYRSLLLLGEQWKPHQWSDVLVEYRAGGISDRRLSATILEQGRVRREILGIKGGSLFMDRLHDANRLVRNGARQVFLHAGINPIRLRAPFLTSQKVLDP